MSNYREDLTVSLKVIEAIQVVGDISFTKAASIEQMRSPGERHNIPQDWNEQHQRWNTIESKAREIHQMILDCLLLEVEENIKEDHGGNR